MQKLLATIATIMGCGIVVLIAQTDPDFDTTGIYGINVDDASRGGGSVEGNIAEKQQQVLEQMVKANKEGTLDSNFSYTPTPEEQKAGLEGQALYDAQAQGK